MNIFVGSLPFSLEEAELKGFFEEYGEVASARIITDKFSGRSKGFGFIEMPNDEEAKKALKAIKNGEVKFAAKKYEKIAIHWLEILYDWNISRQIVWGIRIPAWKCTDCGEWTITDGSIPDECDKCGHNKLIQDADTFDTWFSSGQWPYATLKTTDALEFYPITVMETGYDILRWWVARMVMLGIYIQKKQGVGEMEKQVPFRNIVLHGLVNDPLGKKMSKSKGNVVNPMEIVDQYGADAIRFALTYGTALGNDQVLSYPKLEAMRKFSNKLWNMARFIEMKRIQNSKLKVQNLEELLKTANNDSDKKWVKNVNNLVWEVTRMIDIYQFHFAAIHLYEFIWHQFADKYIEDVKNRIDENSFMVLSSLFMVLLKLLQPFMPFITEEIYGKLYGGEGDLIISQWPQFNEV